MAERFLQNILLIINTNRTVEVVVVHTYKVSHNYIKIGYKLNNV